MFRAVFIAWCLAFGSVSAAEPSREEVSPKRPDDIVALRDVAPDIIEEIRYHGSHNFVGRRIDGYHSPKCLLTRTAALALKRAQQSLKKQNLSLKVYDCYRPQTAVNHFVRWAKDLKDTRMKAEFYPFVRKQDLFRDGYIASRSGHSRGSTVDATLVPLPPRAQPLFTPGMPLTACTGSREERFPDNTLDMGTGYDCFDPRSHTFAEDIPPQAKKNRMLLKRSLEAVGFENYEKEWWHFTHKDEPYPRTYFAFPVE